MTQICTNRDQSIELINSGLNPETSTLLLEGNKVQILTEQDKKMFTPDYFNRNLKNQIHLLAWDLATLIGMMPDSINGFDLIITNNETSYIGIDDDCRNELICFKGNLYETAVSMIKWLIENKYLKTE